jgi:hypothetical protein
MPKRNKSRAHRSGKQDETGYYDHFDLRRIDDLNDDGLSRMLMNVKGINILNVSETAVTNDAIRLLTTLEYVNELAIQGCCDINDDCIDDLNKLTTLRFLYVKDTQISIEGLLRLNNLKLLEKLLFSVDDISDLDEKMKLLQQWFPECSFVVNGTPYIF